VEAFAEKLNIGFITDAGKPSPRAVERALEICAGVPERTALAGDQIFTDILCAGRSGVTGILITPITFRPLKLSNALRALRYVGEMPLRLLCRNKTWRTNK
jgi:predicted HAD superfamily phosphohydrolase YqeG